MTWLDQVTANVELPVRAVSEKRLLPEREKNTHIGRPDTPLVMTQEPGNRSSDP